MPFSLKAGTIGKLSIKLNYFQMFNKSAAPMEVQIHDLFVIVGPNMKQRSNDDSFIDPEEDLIAPYDDSNMYNILTNTLTVKKAPRLKPSPSKFNFQFICILITDEADSTLFDQEVLDLVKSIHLVINRFHIRYEDDYFADLGRPYSFGILVDEFKCTTGQETNEKIVHKVIQLQNARVYWNSLSEMFIPSSLWEQT
jgi:hypothetical protein